MTILRPALTFAACLALGLVTGTALRGMLWYGYWTFGLAVLLAVTPGWLLFLWRQR